MNPDQVVHYKIFLCAAGYEPEIRRITIDKDICHNYFYLKQKILAIFPTLKDVAFTISWKDREGDNIRICTDDELVIALKEMEHFDFKKIYVNATPQGKEGPLHPDVICDGCDNPVQGFRYKCLVCYDYDLCPDCERSQIHPDHPMIRIPLPLSAEMPFGRRFARDISRMSKHLERLFQHNAEHYADKKAKGDYSSGSKTEKPDTKKQHKMKFCPHNDVHNFIHNLVINQLQKMRGVSGGDSSSTANNEQPREGNQPEPQRSSSTTDGYPIYEEQKKFVNILTNGLNSFLDPLGIDFIVQEDPVKEEGSPKRAEPHQSASGKIEERSVGQGSTQGVPVTGDVTQMETTPLLNEAAAFTAPLSVAPHGFTTVTAPITATTPLNLPTVTRIPTQNVGVTALASTVGIPALAPTVGVPAVAPAAALPATILNLGVKCPVSNDEAAPVQAPEPVIPVGPPMSPFLYVDLSEAYATQRRDDASEIDNSWTIINNGMGDSTLFQQPRATFTPPPPPVSFQPTNTSASAATSQSVQDMAVQSVEQASNTSSPNEQIYPILSSSAPLDVNLSLEEAMSRMKQLGFKDEEWLRQLLQSKKGNLQEVLRFLSPIPKPTTSLNN